MPMSQQNNLKNIDFWLFHSRQMEIRFGRDRTTAINQSGSSLRDLPAVVVNIRIIAGYFDLLLEWTAVKEKEVGVAHWQAW